MQLIDETLTSRLAPNGVFGRAKGRREEVLRAAALEFLEKGYPGATIQGIADHLSISKGAAHHRMGSKEQLFYEILVTGSGDAVRRLQEIISYPLTPSDRLRLALLLSMSAMLTEPQGQLAFEVPSYLSYLSAEHRAHVGALRDKYQEGIVQLIEEGIKVGEFRDLPDPKVVGFGLIGLCRSLRPWFRPDGPLSFAQVAEIWWDLAVKGLQAPRS